MAHAIDGLEPSLVWKYFAEISRSRAARRTRRPSRSTWWRRQGNSASRRSRTRPATCWSASRRRPGGRRWPASACRGTSTWSARRTRTRSTTSRRTRSSSCGRATSSWPTARRSAPTTASPWPPCLAIMEDKRLEHGPLEFLFTIDEETGLTGANNLEPGFLREPDAAEPRLRGGGRSSTSGAPAAGQHGHLDGGVRDARRRSRPARQVKGLKGGHSGLEIDKGRGNAMKILTRAAARSGGARRARREDRRRQQAATRSRARPKRL